MRMLLIGAVGCLVLAGAVHAKRLVGRRQLPSDALVLRSVPSR